MAVVGCLLFVALSYALAFGRPSTPRPAGLWRAALVEVGAVVALLLLWPMWLVLGGSYRSVGQGHPRAVGRRHPVVLLHGFLLNRTSWWWMGRRLAARGIGPLYGTSYFSPQSVRSSARHLEGFIERVRAREGAERVDIVAHSLGGVVARYYIERLGGHARVGRLVTVGSPHRGTRLGRFGLAGAARELGGGSSLYAEIGAFSPGVAYSSVWSRADAIVIPPESASVAPVGDDRVFGDLGHLSLLLSPRVADVVAERLSA
jgi:triacylglycerol esterase/lipase EstA (alpha/beta hydrolase family)